MNGTVNRSPHRLKDHYVICNWSDKAVDILTELNANITGHERRATVVVTSQPIDQSMLPADSKKRECFEDVMFYPGDPSSREVLGRVNFHDAHCVIILARPELGEQADARTLLTLFSMIGSSTSTKASRDGTKSYRELIQEREQDRPLHIIAEVVDVSSYSKFKQFEDDRDVTVEIIRAESVRTRVLAQAARTHGLASFFQDLMSYGETTNEVYSVRIPDAWFAQLEANGRRPSFANLCSWFVSPEVRKADIEANPVAIWRAPGRDREWFGTLTNPPDDVEIRKGDHALVISLNRELVAPLETMDG